MSDMDLAAPGVAADEVIAKATEAKAPETEGQAQEGQPAEAAEESGAEDSESKRRRERRERQRERLEQELETARQAAERARVAENRLERIKRAAQSHEPPKEADFSDTIDYAAARGAYAQAQAAARFQTVEAEEEAQSARAEYQRAESARVSQRLEHLRDEITDAKTVYADFDKALAVAQRPDVVSRELSLLVIESDKAADLTYYLGSNPDEAKQLSSLFARNPTAAAMRLGEITARIDRPRPRNLSNAPDPVTPVRGAARATPDPTRMSHEEYRRWREGGGRF